MWIDPTVMGLPMGLRVALFFVCPMNLQGISLTVRYQMGVFLSFCCRDSSWHSGARDAAGG